MAYKYKLSELAKQASEKEAEKELGIPKSRFEVLASLNQTSVQKLIILGFTSTPV